ncbi:MAG: Glycoside hydrolase, 38 vacuolar alpha mannosidase [Cirrosporium novae-zelandiae]|nr:MAG: Glycoside hydrolase, 38 vacuolar alpha mannosidase [Cirrosporium novae-zelandiae]
MGGGYEAPSLYPKLASHPVGKPIQRIYEDRLRQFTGGGQYAGQNLLSKMYEGRASGGDSVKLSVYSPPDLTRPTFKDATSHSFKATKVGESFGPSWSTHWFKVQLKVPQDLLKKKQLELHWDANNEGMVWTEDGVPLQGLTGGGERVEWVLPKNFRDGKEHTFYIEMACNGMFGNAPGGDSIQPPNPNKYFKLAKADIVAVNLEARQLSIDFWIIGDAAREFPNDSKERHHALQICNRIMDTFIAGHGSQDSIIKCREIAKEYIGDVDPAKVYESDKDPTIFAIGHCHIDTCWLWPWAETKRKVARSWANQCDLMDRYPEHRFTCSQAQQYKWLEQYYPALYDRVKEKVKQGTFQPIGGSWVEHDTNMPSGESLVRQFLYGQRFFESHFGERCQTFWLPDTFGYSSQLPQLCRLAGMTRFFTQKLSWNNINNFPHTTFNWVGLDRSQVICHMAPAETYTAEAHFGDVKRSESQHKSMDQDSTSLLVFGKGDGGGGPTFEHIEKLRRCRGVSDKTGLLPRVKMGDSVDDFFGRLEKKADKGTEFVTWYGELYFELHRGTYTTQANNKWNNRKAEIMLHDIEYLAAMASLKASTKGSSSTYKYPKKELDEMWENVLLCQFHDCLPGSSIEMCYDDSDELYAHVFKTGKRLLQDVFAELGFTETATEPAALNTLPWPRAELQKVDSEYSLLEGSMGLGEVKPVANLDIGTTSVKELSEGVFQLSNSKLKLTIDHGAITSLYHVHADREVIPKGQKAAQLVIFDDKPLYWQAWDVEVYHLNSRQELPGGVTEIVEDTPYRVSVMTKTKISDKSWAKQTISLAASVNAQNSYVDIDCEVEWHETMKFLKVEFPVDVANTEASFETQYGIVKRPTHYNTSWDMAKFEVCCHKFADLSEHDYGVSILNDSKYGFAVCGSLMRLSLLRSPKAPDAHADMGSHHIRYAILPHAGPLGEETVRKGYEFNYPLRMVKTTSNAREVLNAIQLEQESSQKDLILDTIKLAEDSGRGVIVRIFDSLGSQQWGTIVTSLSIKKVFKTNVLEDDLEELDIDGTDGKKKIAVKLRPFEVATYRLQL